VSGTFPNSPAFNSLEVSSVQPTFVSRTISGRRQARQIAGQFFAMTATFPPMSRTEFAPINAFIMKQRGQYETFQLILPVLSTGRGTPAGIPLVKGASQTGRSITTDGWTPPATGQILTISDSTPTPTEPFDPNQTDTPVTDSNVIATSGTGSGGTFTTTTDGSGNPTVTVTGGGSSYNAGDTVTVIDSSTNTPTTGTVTVTIATVDKDGILELTIAQGRWGSGYPYTGKYVGQGVSAGHPLTPADGSGNWQDVYPLNIPPFPNQPNDYHGVTQKSTSGSGIGAEFTIGAYESQMPPGSGNPVHTGIWVQITKVGRGYAVGDTLVIEDPGTTTNTVTFTVAELTHNPPTQLVFMEGDYIKFANHDKVYTVTADAPSDTSGESTISFEPALITSPLDNSAITHTSVPFTVALSTGVQEFVTGTSGLFTYEVDFAEVL